MTVLIFLVVLVALILVHELGHFVVAKLSKMRVDEFGIGYPPRLFGFQAGETLYSVNALPFGGFVRIYGEDGTGGFVDARAFSARPKWQQALVLLAGIAMNLLLAWVLFSIILMTPHWISDHEYVDGRALVPAFIQGAEVTIEVTGAIAVGLTDFFVGLFTLSADLSQVTGPVGIAGAVGQAAQTGWQSLLSLTALISINLALINLIPIPALDGGRLFFVLIESITGRPIRPAFAGAMNAAGFVLLILLMVVVTFSDVFKIIGG